MFQLLLYALLVPDQNPGAVLLCHLGRGGFDLRPVRIRIPEEAAAILDGPVRAEPAHLQHFRYDATCTLRTLATQRQADRDVPSLMLPFACLGRQCEQAFPDLGRDVRVASPGDRLAISEAEDHHDLSGLVMMTCLPGANLDDL